MKRYLKYINRWRSIRYKILFPFFVLTAVSAQNYSLSFDGVDDYIDITTNQISSSGSFSYAAWVKLESYPDISGDIIGTTSNLSNRIDISLQSDGSFHIITRDDNGGNYHNMNTAGLYNMPLNTWTHFCLTREIGNTKSFYINGELIASVDDPNGDLTPPPMRIAANESANRFIRGSIDDLQTWTISLSEEGIQEYMYAQSLGNEPNLAGYWSFNNGEGTTLIDQTSNGNNGTIYGATWNTDVPISPIDSLYPFIPVDPTGLPYHIVITDISLNGGSPPYGTEIGLFDGNTCVGTAEYDPTESNSIVTWEGSTDPPLPGFSSGNPIRVLVRTNMYNTWNIYEPTIHVSTGDGNYGTGSYSTFELSITSDVEPNIQTNRTSIDFGTLELGQSAQEDIIVTNVGLVPLQINSVITTNNQFNHNGVNQILQPNESDTIQITFEPTVSTYTGGQLIISTDDPDTPNFSIELEGQGLPTTQPVATFSTNAINYGSITVGASTTEQVQVFNTGTADLDISLFFTYTLNDTDGSFSIQNNAFTVSPGGTQSFSVLFAPDTSGSFSSELTIQSNAPNAYNTTLYLSGSGMDGYFTPIAPTGLPYNILINDITIDGNALTPGDEIGVFEYNSTTESDLCVGSFIYTGDSENVIPIIAWEADPALGLSGFTSGSDIIIKCWATTFDSTLELYPIATWIEGNGSFGEGEYSVVSLTIESGIEPAISTNQSSVFFPNTHIGTEAIQPIQIYNTGQRDLTINSINSNNSSFYSTPTNFVISPEDTQIVNLVFSPQTSLPASGQITIYSDDPNDQEIFINVQGQGLQSNDGEIQALNRLIEFPPTAIGDTSNVMVPLFNSGAGTITVTEIQTSNPSFFSAWETFYIHSGQTVNMPLSFTPGDSVSMYSTSIILYNTSANNPMLSIPTSAFGYGGFFNVVEPTGLPYTVIIDSLMAPEDSVFPGDEIGIFDGSTPVGVVVAKDQSNLSQLNTNSLSFFGNDDIVNCGNDESLNVRNAITISAWIKPSSWGEVEGKGYGRIFEKGPIKLYLHNNSYENYYDYSLVFNIYDELTSTHLASNTQQNSISLDQWQQIVATYDGSVVEIYINGTQQTISQPWGSPSGPIDDHSSYDLLIGENLERSRAYYGLIDEIQLWSRALSQSEVQDYMFTPLSGGEIGLVGYWPFNGGDGSLAEDLIQNNAGVIEGATWSTDVPFTAMSSNSPTLSGIAWEADADNELPGFIPGNPISFRYFTQRYNQKKVFSTNYIPLVGTGSFGAQPFTAVALTAGGETLGPTHIQNMDDITINEDSGENSFTINFNDYFIHPHDPLSFVAIPSDTNILNAHINGSTELSITPADNWSGVTETYIGAFDGYFYAYDTLAINVLPTNDAPVIDGLPDISFNEDNSYLVHLNDYVYDTDNDSTEITLQSSILFGNENVLSSTINDSTHLLTLSPTADSSGTFIIMITATDDSSAVDTDTFSVVINPINDAPYVFSNIQDTVIYRNSGIYTISENLDNTFYDIENDALVYDVETTGNNISAFVQDKTLSIGLNGEFGGTEEFIVSATDGEFTTTDTFNISFIYWSIKVSATNENNERVVYLGASENTTNNLDNSFEFIANNESEWLLYFDRPEWSENENNAYLQDIKPIINLNDTTQVWGFSFDTDVSEEITLNFVFYDYPGMPVKLVKPSSGETWSLSDNINISTYVESGISNVFQVVVGDIIPPSPILDISATQTTSRSATIQWTAPGDDQNEGLAVQYDIRISDTPITEENFQFAEIMPDSTPAPAEPGSIQQTYVTNLEPNTEYYYGIKSTDDAGNTSSLSNILSILTLPVPITEKGAYWGQFHYDVFNTGASPADGATLDSLLWKYETNGWVNSPPVIDEFGHIYFGSEDGFVYALNVDGSLKWKYNTGAGVTAAPLVASLDRLYIGSKSGQFYCFNRTSGDTLWTFQADDQIYSSATLDNGGRLLFGALDGKLYCLDSEFGNVWWSTTVGSRIYSAPALSPDSSITYVGGFDKKVYALDVKTGNTIWNYATNGYILSSLAVDSIGNIYTSSSDKKVYAISPGGELIWTYTTGGSIWYSSPALGSNNDIYIGSDDNKLYCINRADGSLRWNYTTNGDIRNSPAIAGNGNVYFGSTDNTIYQLTQDGELETSVELGGQIQTSSIAIGSGGEIFIGSYDNALYSFGMGDTIPPAIPQTLNVINGDRNVLLSWDENQDPDIAYYTIYRSGIDGFVPAPEDSLTEVWKTTTNIADTSVINGEVYYYRIKAKDVNGNISQASSQVVASPIDLAPLPPTELLTSVGDGTITLTWTPGNEYDVYGHIIYRSEINNFEPVPADSIATIYLPEITFLDSGLVSGWTYFYKISSFDIGGNISQESEQAFGVPQDLTAPSQPTNFVVHNGDEKVTISWNPNAEGDLGGYNLYRNSDSTFTPMSADKIATIESSKSSHIDSGLVNGFAYYYRLTAVDTSGNESLIGDLIIGTPTDQTPPDPPTGLAVISGDHNITLSWAPNTERDLWYYLIYRSETSGFTPIPSDSLIKVSSETISIIDASANNGITYYYKIIAADVGNNRSEPSEEITGTPIDLAPNPPTNILASAGDGLISLNWSLGEEYDLSGTVIYRSFVDGFDPTADDSITTVISPDSIFIDSALTTGLIYYYKLASMDAGGNISSPSAQTFEIPLDLTPPNSPEGFIIESGENQVELSWNPNTEGDLDYYSIYRSLNEVFTVDSSSLYNSMEPPLSSFLDTSLNNGSLYYYYLTATDTTGNESDMSPMVIGAPIDLTPPGDITDLNIIDFTSNYILLRWTATGDDGVYGKAHHYDLRYSVNELTAENFLDADTVLVLLPNPSEPGTIEEISITALDPKTIYYFGVRAIDTTGNASNVSNIVFQKTAETPTLLNASLWGKFHRNNQNTGQSIINGTEVGAAVWTFQSNGEINSSPVIDEKGDVYFGSEDGNVYALNVDGSLKWSYATGGGVTAAPLVATMDRIYVGSSSGNFYCFNRDNGNVIWEYTSTNEIYSSAVIDSSGRLIFGDLGGNLTCLDSEFGTLYWQTSVGNRIYSSPAISLDGTTLYIGGFDKKVYAVNIESGNTLWSHTTNGYLLGSVAVGEDGVIYVGSSGRKLYAINPDGTLKWRYSTSGGIWYSSPAIGPDGEVYIGSDDNKLHSINQSDGSSRWKYSTGGDVRNSPAVSANGNIYFGSTDGNIYALNNDGNIIWDYSTEGQIQSSSAAIGPNGNIYIGSTDSQMYLIGVLDTIPPTTPTGFVAEIGDKKVTLTWIPNEENDLSRYQLFKGLTPESISLFDSVGFAYSSYIDSTVENNIEYFYSIKSVDQLNNRSQLSTIINATPYDQTPPPIPESLFADPGDSEVVLTWDPVFVDDFLRYRVYMMDSDSIWSIIDSTENITETTVQIFPLENRSTYTFAVTAVDTLYNESNFSSEVQSTPYAGPTWYVSNQGNNNNIGYITDPFETIQYAIDYSSDGDTVMVLEGVYSENIIISEKSITVRGLGNPDNIIIDGDHLGSAVTVTGIIFNSVSIENLTISNGTSENGGGVFAQDIALTLKQIIISQNTALGNGGGIYLLGAQTEISNSLIVNNNATNGGGVSCEAFAFCSLWNNTISNNLSSENSGGIYLNDGGQSEIINSIITNNGENNIVIGDAEETSFIEIDYTFVGQGEGGIISANGDITWGENNINQGGDEIFILRNTNDYSLSDFSPLIGSGYSGLDINVDLYNNIRPNPTSGYPDLGAIESPLVNQRPKSRNVYDGHNVDQDWFSDTTVTINWEPFIDDSTITYEFAIGSETNILNDIQNWQNVGSDTLYTFLLSGGNDRDNYYISVRGTDLDNQISDTTISDGFQFDFDSPTPYGLIEINPEADLDYYNSNSSLTFTWSGTDDASGIEFYEYTIFNGDSTIIDWINNGEDTTVVIENLPLMDGVTYSLWVKAFDVAGNVSEEESGDGFLMDYTNPQKGTVYNGENNAKFSSSTSTYVANWAGFSDNGSGLDYYEYSIGTDIQSSDILNWVSNITDTSITVDNLSLEVDNIYYFSVRCIDRAGNTSEVESSAGLTIDLTSPEQGSVFDGLGVDINWTNQTTSFSANWNGFSDSQSGVKEYKVSISSSPGQEDIVEWTIVRNDSSKTFNNLNLNDGINYFVNVIAVDSVENESASLSSDGVTIDIIPPTTAMQFNNLFYSPGKWDDENPLSGVAEDNSSGISYVEVLINREEDNTFWNGADWLQDTSWVVSMGDTSWSYRFSSSFMGDENTYKVFSRAYDNAGNIDESPSEASFIFDSAAPVSTVEIELDYYNQLTWNLDSTITGQSFDGGSGIDSIIVAVERISDNQWYNGTDWSAFEYWETPTLGINPWFFRFSDDILSDSSVYRIHSKAYDVAGNIQSNNGLDIFTYDQTSPPDGIVIDGLDPLNDLEWSNESEAISALWWGFTDIISGINYYEYLIEDGFGNELLPWTNVSTDTFFIDSSLSLESGAQYFVNIRATDGAGNISNIISSSGVSVDTIPPIISYVYEGDQSLDVDYQFDNTIISIYWGGADSRNTTQEQEFKLGNKNTSSTNNRNRNISYYEVSLGTTPLDSNTAGWINVEGVENYTFQNMELINGITYYGNVRAYDQAGNISALLSSDGITIDQTPPSTGVIYDYTIEDLDWTSITYQLEGMITGFSDSLSGIVEYWVSVGLAQGQTQVLDWRSNGPDTSFIEALTLSPGPTYFINAYAVDAVGNISEIISSDGVGVDLVSPELGIVYDGISGDITWSNNDSTLTANWLGFNDALSGIDYYIYSISTTVGEDNIISWTAIDSTHVYTHSDISLDHSVLYYFNVKAVDNVGNASEPASSNGVTVDIIPPTITYISEVSQEDFPYQGSDSTISVFWSGSDNLSGVELFMFSLGESQGDTSISNWENVGLDTAGIATGLQLEEGETYWASVMATDLAGNAIISHGDGVTVDLTPPSVGSVIDISEIDNQLDQSYTGSTTSLMASWSGFLDNLSGVGSYEYGVGSNELEIDLKAWTSVNSDTVATDDSFSLTNGQTYFVSIRAIDNVGNISDVISSNGITSDQMGPNIALVVDGDSTDIDRQNDMATFSGHWPSFSDELSGLQSHEFALYDSTALSLTQEWISINLDTTIFLSGLSLEENHTYHLLVRGIDNVLNTGNTSVSDGVFIDISAPNAPENLIGYFSSERIYLNWDNNTEPDLLKYKIWGSADSEQATIIHETNISESEAYQNEYQETQLIELYVTAVDSLGNESVVSNTVSGFPKKAYITRIIPDTIGTIQYNNQISLYFSQPLNDVGLIDVSSIAYANMNVDLNYTEEDTAINIIINDPWASLDTVLFTLSGIVDWAGNTTDNKQFTFTTYLLGDYNQDFAIDVADLSNFVTGWANDDYSFELGPVSGTPPHFIPSRNEIYDLRDVMAFTRMWHYSHETSALPLMAFRSDGPELDVTQDDHNIIVNLPDQASAAHISIYYPKESKTIEAKGEIHSEDRLQLSYKSEEKGLFISETAYISPTDEKEIIFSMQSLDRNNASIDVGYKIYDQNNQIISSGRKMVEVIAIPDDYALHQNYPNPFNPTTRINYDVPEDGQLQMVIYDLMGREVVTLLNQTQKAGYHHILWNGLNNQGNAISAGMYFCQLRGKNYIKTIKMMLLK